MLETFVAPADHASGEESWTRREILQQPATLRATQAMLVETRDAIDAFVAPLLAQKDLRIMLCGAGCCRISRRVQLSSPEA
jgi:tagatose-6-phosphate ketose/aldose isomerase